MRLMDYTHSYRLRPDMPQRLHLNTRVERIARKHDTAAKWLAENDGARIAAEAEAKRVEAERERAIRIEARRRLAGKLSF